MKRRMKCFLSINGQRLGLTTGEISLDGERDGTFVRDRYEPLRVAVATCFHVRRSFLYT